MEINDIYKKAAKNDAQRYLQYSENQNVSSDIIGYPDAAVIIEGDETHRRTAEVKIDLTKTFSMDKKTLKILKNTDFKVNITQAVIYGWYDNELGSYVKLLSDRLISIADDM